MLERNWETFEDTKSLCAWLRNAYMDDSRLVPTGDQDVDVQNLVRCPSSSGLYQTICNWLEKRNHSVGLGMSHKHRTKIAKICLFERIGNSVRIDSEIWNRSMNRSGFKRFQKGLWPVRKAIRTAALWGLAAATYPDSDANRVSPESYREETRHARYCLRQGAVQFYDPPGPETMRCNQY